GNIQRGVCPGKSRCEHYERHNVRCCRNTSMPEHAYERAFTDSCAVPGHHSNQDNDRSQIHKREYGKSKTDGARDFLYRARLARSDGHKLDAGECVESKTRGEQRRQRSLGEKSSLRGVLCRHMSV